MYGEFEFYDPTPVLRALRQLETSPELQSLPEMQRRLRKGSLKELRESRTAAIFAEGLATVLGTKVLFSPTERGDFDFVVQWVERDESLQAAVQLKELAPQDLNAGQTLQDVIDGLTKYPKTSTILLVLLNRRVNPTMIDISQVPFAELWTLWQSEPLRLYRRPVGVSLTVSD